MERNLSFIRNEKKRYRNIIIILSCASVAVLYPFVFMIMNTLKNGNDILYHAGDFPDFRNLYLDGYKFFFEETSILRNIANTLKIIILQGVFNVTMNTAAAYAMAKINFKGRETLFKIMLWSMMIPGTIMLIPTYIMLQDYVDTFIPLVVPGIMSAYNIFLIRQFILNIPNELLESAKIDGANHLYILTKIVVPMSIPVISTISVLLFMAVWNDLLGPLMYLRDEKLQTIQIGLYNLSSQVQTDTLTARWAGMTFATLPLIILFMLTQKYFIRAFTSFELKG